MHYVYLLQSKLNSQTYIGSTNDLQRRLQEHNDGKEISTRRYLPWAVLYYEAYFSEKLARLREKRLKHNGNALRELKKRVGLLSPRKLKSGAVGEGLPSTTFRPSKSGAGFTILELLLVMAAAILIAAFTIPVGIRFFQTQSLDETTMSIFSTLRRAENQAIFQKNDSAFGVKFLSVSYVLFQGSSYSGRTQSEDESFILSGGITTSGIDEVVFAKLTGIPNITGTLTITSGSDSQTININAQGKIEKQ